ncbi:MAG: IgGFc-binding protein, partial [Paludibacteraceae bacterium]|nr:IgGFc-binding protein [Paludibacteraceae bacterium]
MKRFYLILTALVLSTIAVTADRWKNYEMNSSEGTEFYVTFMHNNSQATTQSLRLQLFMAARNNTHVWIYEAGCGAYQPFTPITDFYVEGDTCWDYPNSTNIYLDESDHIFRSVRVVTDSAISLYAASSGGQIGDATMVLPVTRLGREYVAQTPQNNIQVNELAIIATEPGITNLTITPSTDITITVQSSHAAGVPYTVALSQGDIYYATSTDETGDLSGTMVCADRNVAVFNGCQSTKVLGYGKSSHVCHQALPTNLWGTKYALVMFEGFQLNAVKFTALYDNTVIKKNGRVLTTLNRFESYNYQWNDGQASAYFETSKQTECYQYMPANGLYGAPAMALVPALDQGVQSLRISSFEFTSQTYRAYVNIVLPTSAVDSMMVDSVYVGSQFAPLTGLTGYSFAVIELTAGEHDLTNKKGRFTAIAYSQDETELSFLYNAGLNCMDEYAYILVDGQRVKRKTVCVSTDGMWHINATAVIKGDYNYVEWYDEQSGLWNRKSGDSIWHAGLTSEGLHNVMMLVHKTSPVCGYETIDTVSVEIYNVPSINPVREVMEVCKTDVIDVFGKAISCDTLIVNQIYNFKKMYTNLYGCDSLVTQPVIVLERADSTFNDTICKGDVYIFHDREFTEAGTYIVLDSIGHCPYTDTLNLTVNPTYRFTERDTICQDKLPYSWQWHYEINSDSAGTFTYYDSLKTHLGCDSLYELILTIGEVYLITDTIYECDNHLPYEWHGRQFTETGVYYDSLTSRFDCDSVHRLMLTVSESYLSVDSTDICSNDVVTWRDSVYSGFEEGETVIYDSLVSSMGCDIVYANVLTVRRADIFYTDTTICDNDTVHWREHIISGNKVKEIPAGAEVVDSGYHLISDSMINIVGCDSVYHLRLTVNRSYEETVGRVICQGDSYEFDNMTLTWRNDVAGVYDSTVTYTTAEGCDSVLNLHLTVNPTYSIEFYDTVCNNNSYHWSSGDIDTIITERTAGMYDFHVTFQTVAGCDSTHTLHLTVLDTVAIPSTAFIPDKGSYVWDNERYGGVKSADACDHVLPASPTPYFFRHVYTAANGCDSILTLTIKVDETYDRTLNVTTCQHDDYDFNGTPWSWKKDIPGDHDTIYEYRTIAGYDSIWRMHLHVNPVYLLQQKDSTCRNVPYTWAGHRQTYQNLSPGIHLMYDSLFTKSGCDSVYELSLTVLDTAENVTVISIPDNKVILWDGMLIAGSKYRGHADVYLEDGVYDFHNTYTSTSCGCDSVMHLYLTVTYTFCDSVSVTTCQHEDYMFNGQIWQWSKDEAGLHDTAYVYRSTAGYDSVWRLQLTVIPVYLIEESGSTCENVPYTWKGHRKTFSGLQPGIYTFYDSLKSVVANCDSIYRLTLTVNDTVEHIEYITICDNEEVTWDGETFHGGKLRTGNGRECPARTEPYQFAHQYETTNTHCDSTERLVLYVKPTYEFRRDTMLCSKHGFEFHDTVYTESGTYYDSLRTASGCDSVYVLNLTLDHSTITRQYIGVCEGDSFMFRGKTVKEPGIYIDSLISVVGQCDSIIELHFDILPTYYIRDTVQICDGDSILWHGQCLKYAGTYYDSQKTHSGCDSIYERHVIVAPKFHNIEHDTVCSNQEYHWRGKWFSESGVYFDSMKSRHGCDSVYELRLTLFRPSVYEQYAEICQGGSYTFRGKRITQPGVYYDTIYSVHGCDSIYKLVLNYTQTYHYRDTAQICDGGLLIWRGKNIHLAGTYFDSLKTESGCDSIFELYVRILPKFHDIAYDTVCTDKTYHWRDKWLIEGGIYYDTIKGHYGCDSVYEMRLTMFRPYVYEEYAEVCQGGSFAFRGRVITQPGTYYDSLTSRHGCDSIYKLVLNIAKTYYFRDTVQICDGEVYQWHNKSIIYGGTYRDTLKTAGSGCDSIFEVFVRIAPKFHNIEYDTVCSAQTYHWRGKWLTETGTYFDTLKSSQGCDSVYEMRLTMF